MNRRRFLTVTVGVMVLSVGLVLANYGGGAQGASTNPLTDIIAKLDQILAALTGAAGQNNHTLRWDTDNPSASRFTTAFPGAVLDKNTGLVWEQAPDATARPYLRFGVLPLGATNYCLRKEVGTTVGWRLPSVAELQSVQDPSLPPPFVPTTVFTGVQSDVYWSATTSSTNLNFAWIVHFSDSLADNIAAKTDSFPRAWCVRGGTNADQY